MKSENLPRDICRCNGQMDLAGTRVCQRRDGCARYIAGLEDVIEGNSQIPYAMHLCRVDDDFFIHSRNAEDEA